MRFVVSLGFVLVSTSAYPAFSCKNNADSCPRKLCIVNKPDQCALGIIAERHGDAIILMEEKPGSAPLLHSLAKRNKQFR